MAAASGSNNAVDLPIHDWPGGQSSDLRRRQGQQALEGGQCRAIEIDAVALEELALSAERGGAQGTTAASPSFTSEPAGRQPRPRTRDRCPAYHQLEIPKGAWGKSFGSIRGEPSTA